MLKTRGLADQTCRSRCATTMRIKDVAVAVAVADDNSVVVVVVAAAADAEECEDPTGLRHRTPPLA